MEPGGYRIRIVGQAKDINLQATPTVFAQYGTWEAAVRAANPDAQTPLPNALGVAPTPGVSPDELVTRIDATSDALEALTRSDAATKAPGGSRVPDRSRVAGGSGRACRSGPTWTDRST